MPLEKQVVSLELAKELKELGYPQESLFYWSIPLVDKATTKEQEELLKNCKTELYYRDNDWGEHFESVSAPTVAELGEMLPVVLYNEHYLSGLAEVTSKTEVEARAKMLIYLIKNKLVEL